MYLKVALPCKNKLVEKIHICKSLIIYSATDNRIVWLIIIIAICLSYPYHTFCKFDFCRKQTLQTFQTLQAPISLSNEIKLLSLFHCFILLSAFTMAEKNLGDDAGRNLDEDTRHTDGDSSLMESFADSLPCKRDNFVPQIKCCIQITL